MWSSLSEDAEETIVLPTTLSLVQGKNNPAKKNISSPRSTQILSSRSPTTTVTLGPETLIFPSKNRGKFL